MKRTEELYPAISYDRHRPIVDREQWSTASSIRANPERRPGGAYLPATPAFAAATGIRPIETVLGPVGEHRLNSWAVSGSKTVTGSRSWPTITSPAMPSLWYQRAGLHCRSSRATVPTTSPAGRCLGVARVFIGHNADIAWGSPNLGPDVTDLVLEKVTGDSYGLTARSSP